MSFFSGMYIIVLSTHAFFLFMLFFSQLLLHSLIYTYKHIQCLINLHFNWFSISDRIEGGNFYYVVNFGIYLVFVVKYTVLLSCDISLATETNIGIFLLSNFMGFYSSINQNLSINRFNILKHSAFNIIPIQRMMSLLLSKTSTT